MSAQLMGLVRELKALNARKKAGEELSPDEEARRKELKTFLKSQLEGGSDDAAATAAPPRAATTGAVAAVPPARSTTTGSIAAVAPAAHVAAPAQPRPVTMSAPPVTPPPVPTKPAYVPKKDVFAIGGADAFIEAAMGSEAVARTDPWANRRVHASDGDIADAEAAADAALRANKKRERAVTPEEVEAQLREHRSGYTPAADSYVLEQYYGD
ncbi:MAG TPA: hypothetical protein VGF99_09980, partial [Myxococcota bacterium]